MINPKLHELFLQLRDYRAVRGLREPEFFEDFKELYAYVNYVRNGSEETVQLLLLMAFLDKVNAVVKRKGVDEDFNKILFSMLNFMEND